VRLHELVREQARRSPELLAVSGPDGQLTYGELDRQANALASVLAARGVRPGDRVALCLPKSTRAVTVMQAVLRLGAAYVPIDPLGPIARTIRVVEDCDPRVVVTTAENAISLRQHGISGAMPYPETLKRSDPLPDPGGDPGDLAYILYTSGSTGVPKGVCLSHRNALAFVDWAVAEIGACQADRFANHAPFHFDLSVLDLYAAFRVGASVHLIPAEMSFTSALLVGYLLQHRITVWYSVPSALILMVRDGGMMDVPPEDFYLRVLLYAGEPFPIKYLRSLRDHLSVRILNLYGPTETNVCAFYEVTSIPAGRVDSVPVGRACSGDRIWAERADGTRAGPSEEGELVVDGPSVMLGYWGRPRQDGRPYRTGDRVTLLDSGDYQYLGRRDGMVKVRGYRVEVGEIEAALHAHPGIVDAAVLVSGSGIDAKIVAFVVPVGDVGPGVLELKRHCAAMLPRHMIIDAVRDVRALPRTGNGKLDRRSLAAGLVPDLCQIARYPSRKIYRVTYLTCLL
jgi:amino acid adenylation domain-containing protein